MLLVKHASMPTSRGATFYLRHGRPPMRFTVLTAAILALEGSGAIRADEKKEPASRPEQLEQIQKDVEAGYPEVVKAYQAAKTDEDRSKAVDLLLPHGEKLIKLIAADPKDETALKASIFF